MTRALTIPWVAELTGIPERSLRSAVRQGAVANVAEAANEVRIPLGECAWLVREWSVVSSIRSHLGPNHVVELAVLIGARADGIAECDSEVALVIGFGDDARDVDGSANFEVLWQLESSLHRTLRVPVRILDFNAVLGRPSVLEDCIEEGRVIRDVERVWPRLQSTLPEVSRQAAKERAETQRRIKAILDNLEGAPEDAPGEG